MKFTLREITHKDIEVKTLKELAEAIKADFYGCFELPDDKKRFDTHDPLCNDHTHVAFFAMTDYDSDQRIKHSCTISYAKINKMIDFEEILPENLDVEMGLGHNQTMRKVFIAASDLFECKQRLQDPTSQHCPVFKVWNNGAWDFEKIKSAIIRET